MQIISEQDQGRRQLSAAQIWAQAESIHPEMIMAKHGKYYLTADDMLSTKNGEWLTDQVCYLSVGLILV